MPIAQVKNRKHLSSRLFLRNHIWLWFWKAQIPRFDLYILTLNESIQSYPFNGILPGYGHEFKSAAHIRWPSRPDTFIV